jgi:hypothetical protein
MPFRPGWLTLAALALTLAGAAWAQPPVDPGYAREAAEWRDHGGLFSVAEAPGRVRDRPAVVDPSESGGWLAIGKPIDRKPDGGEPQGSDKHSGHRGVPGLDAQRAKILLRSLTVPGWGQATVGHRRSATVFALAEATIWGAFTAYRIQEKLRTDSSLRTASLFAGVDLRSRDEDFRRLVGAFISNDEYNVLVVYRDAANLYYDDPVRYREYIAQHELTGANAWSWDSESSLQRYRAQRRKAQRAGVSANTALAFAIADRLLSAVHAARVSGHPRAPRSWNIEYGPAGGSDPTAFHLGVRTRF